MICVQVEICEANAFLFQVVADRRRATASASSGSGPTPTKAVNGHQRAPVPAVVGNGNLPNAHAAVHAAMAAAANRRTPPQLQQQPTRGRPRSIAPVPGPAGVQQHLVALPPNTTLIKKPSPKKSVVDVVDLSDDEDTAARRNGKGGRFVTASQPQQVGKRLLHSFQEALLIMFTARSGESRGQAGGRRAHQSHRRQRPSGVQRAADERRPVQQHARRRQLVPDGVFELDGGAAPSPEDAPRAPAAGPQGAANPPRMEGPAAPTSADDLTPKDRCRWVAFSFEFLLRTLSFIAPRWMESTYVRIPSLCLPGPPASGTRVLFPFV